MTGSDIFAPATPETVTSHAHDAASRPALDTRILSRRQMASITVCHDVSL